MVRAFERALSAGRLLAGAAAAGFVGGCTALLPSYEEPKPDAPAGFLNASVKGDADPGLAEWWRLFGDKKLVSLVERGQVSNLDLREAAARIEEARAQRGVAVSGLFPTVDSNFNFSRRKFSTNAFAIGPGGPGGGAVGGGTGGGSPQGFGLSTFNIYQAGFDSTWEIDLFGGLTRAVEAAGADIDAAIESARDVQTSLSAEIGRRYFELLSVRDRLEIAKRNIAAQEEVAEITRAKYAGGLVSGLDASQAEAQLARTRAVLPALETGSATASYRLAVLLGLPPGSLDTELAPLKELAEPPPAVPAGLPSELLRRRPDIRRAERELAASVARVGVAYSDFFPKLSFTGSIGYAAERWGSLDEGTSQFWSVVPGFRWPVFDAGRIASNVLVQEARAEAAAVAYSRTVLNALEEVEGSLVAYNNERKRREALAGAVQETKETVTLSSELYRQGLVDFVRVLDAQRFLFEAEDALAESEREVRTKLITLFKALGGGWEVPKEEEAGRTTGT